MKTRRIKARRVYIVPKSKRIKASLMATEYRKRAIKFHDKLILEFLNCFKDENHEETEMVKNKIKELNEKWIQLCKTRSYPEDAKTIFIEQIDRIMKRMKDEKLTYDLANASNTKT